MKDDAARLDGHTLAAHYEALRQDAVESGGGSRLRGRALLIWKGMVVWMRCVGEIPVPRRLPSVQPLDMKLPAGLQQQVVDIVASMALAIAPEVA